MGNLKIYYCTKFQRDCPDPLTLSCDGWERVDEERLMCLHAEESSVLEEGARSMARHIMVHLMPLKLNKNDAEWTEEEIFRHLVEFGRELLDEASQP